MLSFPNESIPIVNDIGMEINMKDVEMEYDKKSKTYQIKMGVPQEDIDLLGSEEGAIIFVVKAYISVY